MARNPVTRIIITAKDEASAVFSGLRAHAGKIATAIAGYFGARMFGDVVGAARDFESAMSAVQAAAGASGDELAKLRAAAEQAGATTKYSSVEAANALENLAKSGLSASQAVEALPAVLNLASAGGVELGTAAEFITKAVNGMGLAFSDAGRVADVLAMGANASNTSVTGLAQALSYAAPLANSLGLSLEQTVAIIGKFADAGIDAGRAGTALNSILAQFSDPASKFRRELADAGITTTDFDQALRQLAAAGPSGQRAINAVGQEAGPALRALLNQGIGALDTLKGKLDESAGSAATFAKVMSDNLDGAAKGFGSAWDALLIKLGTPVLGTLATQINAVSERLRAFVTDGTATAFGNAIRAAFETGGKWVADFVSKIDFTQVAASLQAFATRTGEVFTAIGQHASTASNTIKTAYGVMSAGVNVVLGTIYKLGQAMSWVASAFLADLAKIADGIDSITPDIITDRFGRAADALRLQAQAAYAVFDEFGKRADGAFTAATEGANMARDGFSQLAGSAGTAVREVAGLAAGYQAATTAAQQSSAAQVSEIDKIKTKIAELQAEQQRLTSAGDVEGATRIWKEINRLSQEARDAVVTAAADMAASTQSSSAAQQAAAAAAQAKIAELRVEYERLIEAGDTQAAAQKLIELQQELGRTGAKASFTADEVEQAFQQLGITSQAELDRLAQSARRSFDLIRESGAATPRELQAAWMAYAEKAIAANGDVASSALKAEGAIYGVRVEADNTLTAIDKMGNAGQAAGSRIESGMGGAADAVGDVGDQADRSADRLRRLQQLQQQGGGGGGGGVGGGGQKGDPNNPNVIFDKKGSMVALINNSTDELFDKWDSQRKDLGGPAESPVLGILNRAEQLGGLEMRKQFENEFQRRAKRQGMRVASFGTADYNRFWQSVSDQLDAIQIEQERASGRYESNQPRIVGQQPREQITTYRVQIGTGAGRTQTINTASRADADALTELLRQLEADMSRA